MSAPAAPGHNPAPDPGVGRSSFESVADGALRDRALGTSALPTPADPEPRALLRYVAGAASQDERPALEGYVSRSSWAYERVIALVRAARPDAPPFARALAKRLATAPTAGAAVAAAMLESRGQPAGDFESALEKLEGKDDRVRAALLLGLGRHDEARKLLEGSRRDALSDLILSLSTGLAPARWLTQAPSPRSGAPDPDQALLAVLDAFPALLDHDAAGRSRRP